MDCVSKTGSKRPNGNKEGASLWQQLWSDRRNRGLLLVAATGACLAIGLLVVGRMQTQAVRDAERKAAATATTSQVGGPFRVIDHEGNTVTEADLLGQATLLYFGYAYCPDICPTDLQFMADVLDAVGPEAAGKAQIFFATIDPARDTPERLAQHVKLFHPAIRGLTGSEEQMAAMAATYKSVYRKVPLEGGGPDDYLMDHAGFMYLIDAQGRFIRVFSQRSSKQEMTEALKAVLP
jgi:cytochrome oxidase Cu insertion factor (SCO1/SenC/PrrC family)